MPIRLHARDLGMGPGQELKLDSARAGIETRGADFGEQVSRSDLLSSEQEFASIAHAYSQVALAKLGAFLRTQTQV